MKQLCFGAAIAALVMFVWGFLFWGVLPFGSGAINAVPDEASAQAWLKESLPASGVYMLPFSEDVEDTDYQLRHTAGPIATIYLRMDGSEPMAPSTFVLGYLHEFVVMFIMGLMLKLSGMQYFGGRLAAVFLAGLAGSVFAHLGGPIWWLQPWGMAVTNVIYEAFAWLFGAFALAAIISPASRRDSNEM